MGKRRSDEATKRRRGESNSADERAALCRSVASSLCRFPRRSHPRGSVVVGMIVLLLVVNLIIVGVVLGGARDHDLTARRLETVQAFYAAEAGMNMAIRELMNNADEDGDGAIGSVSDDGDDGNDPSIAAGRVYVTQSTATGTTTVTSIGSAGEARRHIEATLN